MIYLQAWAQLERGKLPEFIDLLSELIPLVGQHDWKLLYSFTPMVGEVETIIDLWELPDASAVERATADPRVQAMAKRSAGIIRTEKLQLLAKLPVG